MLRHLLLALFLIGLSLPAVSNSEHAEGAPVNCHSTQPSSHKPDGDTGKAAGHFCIGCVAQPSLPVIAPMLSPPPARAIAQPIAALAGTDAPPGLPPPRA